MANLTSIPDRIDAGTSVEITLSYGDYPASSGWTAKLILHGAARLIKAAATNADGKSFDITLASTDTDDLSAGIHDWTVKVANGSNIKTAATGRLEVFPDVEVAAAGTLQSWEEIALRTVEKVIAWMNAGSPAGRLAADIQEYEIAGRRVVKHDLKDLIAIRDDLHGRVRARLHPGRLVTPVRTQGLTGFRP